MRLGKMGADEPCRRRKLPVVMAVDLPLDWLIAVAMLSGGLATFAVTYFLHRRR
jgi:hypothetical protein